MERSHDWMIRMLHCWKVRDLQPCDWFVSKITNWIQAIMEQKSPDHNRQITIPSEEWFKDSSVDGAGTSASHCMYCFEVSEDLCLETLYSPLSLRNWAMVTTKSGFLVAMRRIVCRYASECCSDDLGTTNIVLTFKNVFRGTRSSSQRSCRCLLYEKWISSILRTHRLGA